MDNAVHLAKGGGGRASSARSSISSSRSSTSSRSSSSSSKSGTARTEPGSTFKSPSGKTVKSSATKPSNSKYGTEAGTVGADGYSPRFKSGYTAPEGSVVYYPRHSALDYLPWVYLFSQDSPSFDNAVVVQPDDKQVIATPDQGVDGMAVFNWLLIIVFIAGAIWGVMWMVDRATAKEPRYGW